MKFWKSVVSLEDMNTLQAQAASSGKRIFASLEDFFAALASGELDKSEVVMHFDSSTFYAMDTALEHEYISGEWEDVYAYFKFLLKNAGVKVYNAALECEE